MLQGNQMSYLGRYDAEVLKKKSLKVHYQKAPSGDQNILAEVL